MCFGLLPRNANATTEYASFPPYDCFCQLGATRPASTSVLTSSPVDRKTRSAFRPAATARAWSPDGPYDVVNDTPLPSGVCSQAEMILPITVFGVE